MTTVRQSPELTLEAFSRSDIDKPTFIRTMYDTHHDYSRFIGNTHARRIEIEDSQVVMASRDRGMRIVCAQGDMRIAPVESLNFGDDEKQDAEMMEALVADGDPFFARKPRRHA